MVGRKPIKSAHTFALGRVMFFGLANAMGFLHVTAPAASVTVANSISFLPSTCHHTHGNERASKHVSLHTLTGRSR